MELILFIAGFIAGIFVYLEIIRWVYTLLVVWGEYRIAKDFPHLQRRASLWPVPLLFLLHSGPWFLVVVVISTYKILTGQSQPEWFWFLGGFYAYGVIIGVTILTSLRTYSTKQSSENKP